MPYLPKTAGQVRPITALLQKVRNQLPCMSWISEAVPMEPWSRQSWQDDEKTFLTTPVSKTPLAEPEPSLHTKRVRPPLPVTLKTAANISGGVLVHGLLLTTLGWKLAINHPDSNMWHRVAVCR